MRDRDFVWHSGTLTFHQLLALVRLLRHRERHGCAGDSWVICGSRFSCDLERALLLRWFAVRRPSRLPLWFIPRSRPVRG